ncbi:hypothetical protein RSJ22_00295 (plasmid) [Clostridium botulinum]|uniref:phage structural protein n=1 Tax=Clostridium botulinum TaxID=1491 RepID=UPI000C772B91|nr:hypothetical protein [Clostridium botulinum]AUN19971.1 hypothetical protein RSJ22_00295 [Clostridium botulinum]MCR1167273.1 hypothetical protein [Clostridium botulinum]
MIKPYNPELVNLILTHSRGTHYVTGFSNGSEIACERESDKYVKHTGMKGDTTFARSLDKSGTITFSLKHDSPSNKLLYTLSEGDTTFDTQLVDGNDVSKSKAGGTECVIMKPANLTRGSEIAEQEWVIAVPALDMKYE